MPSSATSVAKTPGHSPGPKCSGLLARGALASTRTTVAGRQSGCQKTGVSSARRCGSARKPQPAAPCEVRRRGLGHDAEGVLSLHALVLRPILGTAPQELPREGRRRQVRKVGIGGGRPPVVGGHGAPSVCRLLDAL